MTEINNLNGINYPAASSIEKKEKELELSDISVLYTTEKTEDKRSDFENTYNEKSLNEASQGAEFLNGLIENKDFLSEKLGLSDEQYDSLACVALALASQETGMGYEDGYVGENTGLGGFGRRVAKWFDVNVRGNMSASSGLTQMKIYDFMNSDSLTPEQKNIISEAGIKVKGVATNNLYDEPDKAAAATIVVLSSIVDNYDDYTSLLENEHKALNAVINDNLSEQERTDKGEKILSDISDIYKNSDNKTKIELRSAFKQWLLSKNGSTLNDRGDKSYNEEYQLNRLNNLLSDVELSQDDLNYIRCAMTSKGQEMSITEYCAYAWNKGTGETGMQLDRLLADKVGVLLSNPEDFDYDQFTVNVSTLAEKYARQSIQNDVLLYMNSSLADLMP